MPQPSLWPGARSTIFSGSVFLLVLGSPLAVYVGKLVVLMDLSWCVAGGARGSFVKAAGKLLALLVVPPTRSMSGHRLLMRRRLLLRFRLVLLSGSMICLCTCLATRTLLVLYLVRTHLVAPMLFVLQGKLSWPLAPAARRLREAAAFCDPPSPRLFSSLSP